MRLIYKDAVLIDLLGTKYEADRVLIRTVARYHGFFELQAKSEKWTRHSGYMDASEMLRQVRQDGGTVIVAASHRDFEAIRAASDLEWQEMDVCEFEMFGKSCGFCHECLAKLEEPAEKVILSVCGRCLAGEPVEPRQVAKEAYKRLFRWHARHGDKEAAYALLQRAREDHGALWASAIHYGNFEHLLKD